MNVSYPNNFCKIPCLIYGIYGMNVSYPNNFCKIPCLRHTKLSSIADSICQVVTVLPYLHQDKDSAVSHNYFSCSITMDNCSLEILFQQYCLAFEEAPQAFLAQHNSLHYLHTK